MDWILSNYIQILGVVSALLFLYFEYKESVWLWPLGLLSAAIYTVVFLRSQFYADMALQIYYVLISIYGWWIWIRKNPDKENPIAITRANNKLIAYCLGMSLILWAGLFFVLDRFTDSPVPVGDAFTSAFAIVATWMLSRKYLQQWVFWIVINFVSSALYFYKGDMTLTALLYIVYGGVSIMGYYEWRRKANLAG